MNINAPLNSRGVGYKLIRVKLIKQWHLDKFHAPFIICVIFHYKRSNDTNIPFFGLSVTKGNISTRS